MVRYAILFSLFFCVRLAAQETIKQGEVTFITTSNIYVRFDDTSLIQIGDSLHLDKHKDKPCLLVNSKSSTSCVCVALDNCEVAKGTKVTFIAPSRPVEPIVPESITIPGPVTEELELPDLMYPQEIRARISASTYSLVATNREDRHRLMSRLSIDADHINDSRFSADVYMNFRHIVDGGNSNLQNNSMLRIFNFSVNYEASPSLDITLGRSINPKITSLGAIDGLQAEKRFEKSYVGVLLGSRPDIFNFGYNPRLLEYGAYYGVNTRSREINAQSTLGIIEQRGNGDIDRRYAYLQHSSTLFGKLNFFTSAELDIFSKVNYTTKNELRLSSLYASLRYRFSKRSNLMVSYDNRKRIIYYETYRSDIERLLDDDLARQGLRGRVNFRPYRNVFTGFSYSKRFQSDQQNSSENLYGYVTLTRTPFIDGRTSLSYNRNESNYLLSNIASIRHSRSLMRNRLNTDFYYRFVQYDYDNLNDKVLQHFVGADVTYNINRSLLFSVSGEYSMYDDNNNYRIYTRIIQRFHSKHKN